MKILEGLCNDGLKRIISIWNSQWHGNEDKLISYE